MTVAADLAAVMTRTGLRRIPSGGEGWQDRAKAGHPLLPPQLGRASAPPGRGVKSLLRDRARASPPRRSGRHEHDLAATDRTSSPATGSANAVQRRPKRRSNIGPRDASDASRSMTVRL